MAEQEICIAGVMIFFALLAGLLIYAVTRANKKYKEAFAEMASSRARIDETGRDLVLEPDTRAFRYAVVFFLALAAWLFVSPILDLAASGTLDTLSTLRLILVLVTTPLGLYALTLMKSGTTFSFNRDGIRELRKSELACSMKWAEVNSVEFSRFRNSLVLRSTDSAINIPTTHRGLKDLFVVIMLHVPEDKRQGMKKLMDRWYESFPAP